MGAALDDIAGRAEAVLERDFRGSRSDKIGSHFLGAIVLNQIKVYGRQVDTVEVIDGQQRLTTLQLMLAGDVEGRPRRRVPLLGRYEPQPDLFHQDVPIEYIQRVFDVMRRAHWHRFQVLTKRAERLAKLSAKLEWTPNIWMGVKVESDKYRSRIDELRSTGALTKFLSLEPLLGPLHDLDLRDIDWVIVGGESGPKARPMEPAWATDLRDQCKRAKVPFFFKRQEQEAGGPSPRGTNVEPGARRAGDADTALATPPSLARGGVVAGRGRPLLLTGRSRRGRAVNCSLPLSTPRAPSESTIAPARPVVVHVRVLSIAPRDQARAVNLAQNLANTGVFMREAPRVASRGSC